jgi:hypothetical protein
VKVSELLSIEKCDQAVMDFLAATGVGRSHPKWVEDEEAAGNRRSSKGRRALLDFIPFPLYYMSATFGCFFLLSKGDDG